jgi:cyclopropane fatty-acyl-phospholipid synthase-like methyltransferase
MDIGASLRAVMYGEDDLSSMSLFSGNFINFGYWQDLTPGQHLTIDDRTASQADLYRTVLHRAGVGPSDSLLEVGCGIGVGAALALQEFGPRVITGVDISNDQIARALDVNAATITKYPDRLVFQAGSALTIPAENESFDKCISVEAAQHFEDLAMFAREAHRVLKPAGTLALATFFSCHDGAIDQLRPLIETIDNGIDVVTPIAAFENHLRAAGFVDLRIEAIGELVWHGCDAWRAQTEYSEEWGRNWLKAYKAGLIDYYMVIANKATTTD